MQSWKRLTKDEVLSLLKPFWGDLSLCIYEPFDEWRNHFCAEFPVVTDRGFANIMYEKIIERAADIFARYSHKEVHMTKIHDSLKLTFMERILARFKKFRPDHHTSNYPTKEEQLFSLQEFLPVWGKADRINVGYLPDETRTEVEAFITYTVGRTVLWHEPLPRKTNIAIIPPSEIGGQGSIILPFRPKDEGRDSEGKNKP